MAKVYTRETRRRRKRKRGATPRTSVLELIWLQLSGLVDPRVQVQAVGDGNLLLRGGLHGLQRLLKQRAEH